MSSIEQIQKEAEKIQKVINKEHDVARVRKDVLEKELQKKYGRGYLTTRYGIDTRKAEQVTCPECKGTNKMPYFDSSSILTGFRTIGECNFCRGITVWFDYNYYPEPDFRDNGCIC